MHHAEVSIVLDSISRAGVRITTFKLRYWRGIHSELMTHRALSKNAGSSRARPSQGIIEQVRNDPWGPLHWGVNQPGMQASQELSQEDIDTAKDIWREAANNAANSAQGLLTLGAHKQVVNRLLEGFSYIDVVLTGTDFENFFTLRDDDGADPTIRDLAVRMKAAREASVPKLLRSKEWHMPFINEDDHIIAEGYLRDKQNTGTLNLITANEITKLLLKICVARCARTSYKAFDGTVAPIEKDLELCDKLLAAAPLHASPAEHQARPDFRMAGELWGNKKLHGNFTGWIQYRKTLPNEYVPG